MTRGLGCRVLRGLIWRFVHLLWQDIYSQSGELFLNHLNAICIRLCFEIRNLLVQFAAKSFGRTFHAFLPQLESQLHWEARVYFNCTEIPCGFFLLQAWLFGHYHEWMARNWFKSLCTCSLLDLVYYNEKQTIKKMLSKIHKPFLKVNTPYWFVKFVIALKFRVSRCSQGSLRRRETLEIFIPKIKK